MMYRLLFRIHIYICWTKIVGPGLSATVVRLYFSSPPRSLFSIFCPLIIYSGRERRRYSCLFCVFYFLHCAAYSLILLIRLNNSERYLIGRAACIIETLFSYVHTPTAALSRRSAASMFTFYTYTYTYILNYVYLSNERRCSWLEMLQIVTWN